MRAAYTKHMHSKKTVPILQLIQQETGLSAARSTELIQQGAVWHRKASSPENSRAKRCVDTQALMLQDDYVRVHSNPKRFDEKLSKIDWSQKVISDHHDFVLINKPAGIPSTPLVDNLYQCVPECLKPHVLLYPDIHKVDMSVLHRLDIDTQGMMILGKSPAFISAYNRYMRRKLITRAYRAVICSVIDPIAPNTHGITNQIEQPTRTLATNGGGHIEDLLCSNEMLHHQLLVTNRSPKLYLSEEQLTSRQRNGATKVVDSIDSIVDIENKVKRGRAATMQHREGEYFKEAISECEQSTPHVAHTLQQWQELLPSIAKSGSTSHSYASTIWHHWLENARTYVKEEYYPLYSSCHSYEEVEIHSPNILLFCSSIGYASGRELMSKSLHNTFN